MDPKKSKKKPELQDQLYVGNYVDAYHVNGKQYRLAYIISKTDSQIEVTYDGMSKKDNETFKLQSNKIYFARRFTINYTGDDYRGSKTTREYLKYSNEECIKKTRELKDIQKDYMNMSAIDITQSIRVRQFIWLDMVLSIEFQINQIPVVLEYLKEYFNFIVWYLTLFPQYYQDYIRSVANQELFLTDERVAFALCFGEITEAYCLLQGTIWRVLKLENSAFYLNYDLIAQQMDKVFNVPIYGGFTTTANTNDWKLYAGATDIMKCIKKTWPLYLKMMSYFRSIGGLAAWDNLLKQNEQGDYMPLKIIQRYALVQQYLSSYYQLNEQGQIAKRTMEWMLQRANNLTMQEIKDTDVDTVKDTINEMDYLFQKAYSLEQIQKQVDEVQLQLALRFLKSPFLEKRVKGLTEIKDFAERVRIEIQPIKMRTSYNKDELLRWIRDQKILELSLLGDSVHLELIKRTHEIAIFLGKNNAFPCEMIDRIWIQNQDKHESTQLAIYEFFKALAPALNFEGLDALYQHLKTIPYQKYTESIVSLIRTFSECILVTKHAQQAQDRNFMTFNNLWELLQDREDNLVPFEIQDQCFQAARQIVSTLQLSKAFVNLFFGKCFELIRDHKSVYQAISFVHYFLDKQFREDQQGKRILIKQTNEKYNIIELFVKDVEVYLEKVRQHFGDQVPTDVTIWGVQTYQQNVFFRLQMLNYLLQSQDLKIGYDHVVRLYDCTCFKTKGGIQKRELNQIFLQSRGDMAPQTIARQYFPNHETELRFFTQVLCNPLQSDYENYTQEDFDMFNMFFKSVNQAKGLVKFIGSAHLNRLLVLDNVEGKAAIWEIFKRVKDPKIVDVVSNLLITLHTQLHSQMKVDRVQNEMMDKCLEFIQLSNASLTSRSINLITLLFQVFQNGQPSKKAFKSNGHCNFKAQIMGDISRVIEVREGDQCTIHQWKQKLANDLQVAYKQLEIVIDNKQVENGIDAQDALLSQTVMQFSTVKIIVNKKYHPRNYLSQDQHTFDILFRLIKQDNGEFSSQVWDLVNQLPLNQVLLSKVQDCKSWNQFLDYDFYDMFYVLQIVNKLLENPQWSEQFMKSDGVGLVIQKFLGQKLEFRKHPLEKKCCLIYLEIIRQFTLEDQNRLEIQAKVLDILRQLPGTLGATMDTRLLKLIFHVLGDGLKNFIMDVHFPRYLQSFLIEHNNQDLKKEFQIRMSQFKSDQIFKSLQEAQLVLKACMCILPTIVQANMQSSSHYFDLICDLIQDRSIQLDPHSDLTILMNFVLKLPQNEITHKDHDQLLIGLLKVINALLERFPMLSNKEVFLAILHLVLEENVESQCKCKSHLSRSAAFSCIQTLIKNGANMGVFLSQIAPLHSTSTWRTKHHTDWNIQSRFHEKSPTGFCGLYNLGCICYMNSLLQQLYMVPTFRERLLATPTNGDASDENLHYQMKCLFLALKYSQKQYHNPKKFCHAFKDLEGNPTNIFEQMDVDEFCNLLMDRIEASLKGGPDEDLVKTNFGGVMSNEIIGKSCPHYSEREEPFYAISLPVSNKKTIEECLQTLIQGDMLEGDNAYNCDQCQKKVNALKRMCIKKLPDHLILVLKRFNYDFDIMAKAKINDRIEFPFQLNLEAYSQQGLRKEENVKLEEQELPAEYFQYQLSGAVIHLGGADAGHYYSFIQDKQDRSKWYEFNDTVVTQSDQKDVINDGFGGGDKSSRQSKYAPQMKDKSKSAYMLFYERIKKTENLMEIEEKSSFLDEIKEENRKFQIQRFIFSPEYFHFMHELLKSQLQAPDDSVTQMLVYFFLTCAVREFDKQFLTNNIVDLISLLRKSIPTCEWLIRAFTNVDYIREFQFECSKKMVRKYVITLLEAAIQTVQAIEGPNSLYQVIEERPKSIIAALINLWIIQIAEVKKSLRNSAEFFDLFYRFAIMNPINAQYLNSKRLIGRLMDFFIDAIPAQTKLRQYQEEVRKVDDIRLWECTEPLLGQQNTTQSDAASHYYDDILEKKYEKSLGLGASNRVYLWRTISELLKFTKISQLSSDEQALLNIDQPIMLQLLEEGDSKLGIRMISDILCILCSDPRITEMAIQAIMKHIHDKEHKEYRKYLVVLKRLFLIKDNLQQNRIQQGMLQLIQTMQKQSQYFFETDICQQYILRIAKRNPQVHQWLNKSPKVWSWIIENIEKSQIPNEKLLANNANPSKCHHRMHNIYLPQNAQAYVKLLQWKKQQFLAILKEPFQPNLEFDSDDDMTGKVINPDDKLDYYYSEANLWTQATVTKVMADYVRLQFAGRSQPNTQDIEVDSERLAPLNTLSNNNKVPGMQLVNEEPKSDNENETEDGNQSLTDSDEQ